LTRCRNHLLKGKIHARSYRLASRSAASRRNHRRSAPVIKILRSRSSDVTLLVKEIQMSRENQANLFIRILVEEFEAYRTDKKLGFSRQASAQAKCLRRPFKTGHSRSAESPEPLDCLQLMSTAPQPRYGQ